MGRKYRETHVYQHKIPQVYMKYWSHQKGEEKMIYAYNKEEVKKSLIRSRYESSIQGKKSMFEVEAVSTSTVGGENDFYTIFKNSLICNEEDKRRIKSGELRILDIENNLGKIENRWTSIADGIINNTSNNKTVLKEFKKKEIIYFTMTMYFRGNKGVEKMRDLLIDLISNPNLSTNLNNQYREILTEILKEEKEFSKEFLLNELRKLFNKEGLIYKLYELIEKNCTIIFSKAKGNIKFITSDNPSLKAKIKDKGEVITMPITPNIIIEIVLNREGNKQYKVFDLDDKGVINFNQMIFENSKEFVISNVSNIFDSIATR